MSLSRELTDALLAACPVAGPRSVRGRQRRPAALGRPPTAGPAGAAGEGRLHHEVPGRVLHRHGGRGQGYAAREQPGDRGRATSPARRRRTSRARPRRSRTRWPGSSRRIVITPMGPEVVPAMTAAADKGRQGGARRQQPGRLHEEDRGGGDRQRQGRPGRGRLPQDGAQAGRHHRPDGGRARRPGARRPHPGGEGRADQAPASRSSSAAPRPSATPRRAPPSRRTC